MLRVVTSSSSSAAYFSNKRLDEIFIVGTHNSLALPGKVLSPNQNHGLATQFADGIRLFNLDLYYDDVQGKVVTSHGPGLVYDPSDQMTELLNAMGNNNHAGGDFVIIQLQDAVRSAEKISQFFSDTGFASRLVKNFDITKSLGDYIQQGQDVLLVTDAWGSYSPTLGIHYSNDFVTENDYTWTSCYFDSATMSYRRGPKSGLSFKLMNYFCSLTSTGDIIASGNTNQKHRILYSVREFIRQGYTGGKINGILVDYYDEGDVFGAQAQVRAGDLNDGCWGDGSKCGDGTTCWNCCRDSEWWDQKVFTACGKEPCWSDGARCGAGTTCNNCCNGYEWWDKKFFTACGQEPCWSRGATCGKGTTCGNCCSGSADCPWYKFGVCKCK